MSSKEESPAQQAARLRRERREAKIKEGGSARLSKITSMSGRPAAAAMYDSSPPSTGQPSPTPESQPQQPSRSVSPLPQNQSNAANQSPEAVETQEAYLRALLRSKQPVSGPPPGQDPDHDAAAELLGGFSAAAGMPGPEDNPDFGNAVDMLSGSLSSFGIPRSATNFVSQQLQPESADAKRSNQIWKVIHSIFALVVGIYLVVFFQSSVSVYGDNPPAPATAQNPFVHFITGELLLGGTRLLMKTGGGKLRAVRPWTQLVSSILRDGRIVLFILGIASLWVRTKEDTEAKH